MNGHLFRAGFILKVEGDDSMTPVFKTGENANKDVHRTSPTHSRSQGEACVRWWGMRSNGMFWAPRARNYQMAKIDDVR